MVCGFPSSRTMKSSLARPRTGLPFASVTTTSRLCSRTSNVSKYGVWASTSEQSSSSASVELASFIGGFPEDLLRGQRHGLQRGSARRRIDDADHDLHVAFRHGDARAVSIAPAGLLRVLLRRQLDQLILPPVRHELFLVQRRRVMNAHHPSILAVFLTDEGELV